jgi:hypothetical protein
LVGSGLCGLIPLFLCHLFVLGGPIFGARGTLLRRALSAKRRVAREIARRLLAASEKLVEESHVPSGV